MFTSKTYSEKFTGIDMSIDIINSLQILCYKQNFSVRDSCSYRSAKETTEHAVIPAFIL
jgi:hypothetical protein